MPRILIVDDDELLGQMLAEELDEAGYSAAYCADAKEALAGLAQVPPDLMLLDLKMPGLDGLTVLRQMQDLPLPCRVVIMTAYADVHSAMEAARLGANELITKPFQFDELKMTIEKVLGQEISS